MSFNNWIKEKLELYKDDFEFRLESLILDITENISEKMLKRNINRTKLAEKLNVSRPAVSKILNGNSNFTLKTLLSLSDALSLDLKVKFKEREVKVSKDHDVYKSVLISSADEIKTESKKIEGPFPLTSSDWQNQRNEIPYIDAA
ncbi:MAG: helix-turn-helix transcriptional regulator [Deltaproteobacteria bacterium]|nr:helix-turn-helix transcriptional regulator [Deltaproteobacteria bacterium]MBW2090345.1 helix-turn-helix transcriptional regulator [Deltaproteobacteria bacterium]